MVQTSIQCVCFFLASSYISLGWFDQTINRNELDPVFTDLIIWLHLYLKTQISFNELWTFASKQDCIIAQMYIQVKNKETKKEPYQLKGDLRYKCAGRQRERLVLFHISLSVLVLVLWRREHCRLILCRRAAFISGRPKSLCGWFRKCLKNDWSKAGCFQAGANQCGWTEAAFYTWYVL